MRRLLFLLLLIVVFPSGASASNNAPPEGMAFAGLVNDEWKIHVVRDGSLSVISDIEHPRTFSYHAPRGRIAYIGADGHLRIHDLDDRTPALTLDLDPQSRYTQPAFSDDGQWLLVVELPGGKSRRTNIVGIDLSTGTRHGFVRKRTAQFEPSMNGDRYLHYTTATCVDDCGGMIWELWRRDMHTGQQYQLTLLNAVSNQPHAHDERVYFSADADGGRFHIWEMEDEVGAPPRQLTFGDVRDSDPVTDKTGTLYFLRKTRDSTTIMKLDDETPVSVDIDQDIVDIRNLEISW